MKYLIRFSIVPALGGMKVALFPYKETTKSIILDTVFVKRLKKTDLNRVLQNLVFRDSFEIYVSDTDNLKYWLELVLKEAKLFFDDKLQSTQFLCKKIDDTLSELDTKVSVLKELLKNKEASE